MLAPTPPERRLTIDEFFAMYAGRAEKWELVEGVPVMMAGGTRRHNRVTRNLAGLLFQRLAGSRCEVFTAGMGVETAREGYRLPGVAIYCDPRDLDEGEHDPVRLRFPRVVIEVLSPLTAADDFGAKLAEYQAIPSVDTIVMIHPVRRTLTMFERVTDVEWRNVVHMPGAPLTLRDPALTVAADDIFAGT